MAAAILQSLTNLFVALHGIFGTTGLWVLIVLVFFGLGLWLWWSHEKKQRELERMLTGYELYMQSVHQELRTARIEKFIVQGRDPVTAAATVDSIYSPGTLPKFVRRRTAFARLLRRTDDKQD